MKIGDLALIANCPVETIRYYERAGVLPPPERAHNNYRTYGAAHVERLRFIRHCRLLDMSLDEIRQLLHFRDAPASACGEVNHIIDRHLDDVRNRIAQLQSLEQNLAALRSRCAHERTAADCGILQELNHS